MLNIIIQYINYWFNKFRITVSEQIKISNSATKFEQKLSKAIKCHSSDKKYDSLALKWTTLPGLCILKTSLYNNAARSPAEQKSTRRKLWRKFSHDKYTQSLITYFFCCILLDLWNMATECSTNGTWPLNSLQYATAYKSIISWSNCPLKIELFILLPLSFWIFITMPLVHCNVDEWSVFHIDLRELSKGFL